MYLCSNTINICIKNNKKGFILKKNKKNINNIKIFLKLNILKYIKIEKNNIICYINYVNNKPIFKNIINLYKSSNKKIISCKNLKKLIKKKNRCLFILSTNKGIIDSYTALKFNVGGVLLSQIWN